MQCLSQWRNNNILWNCLFIKNCFLCRHYKKDSLYIDDLYTIAFPDDYPEPGMMQHSSHRLSKRRYIHPSSVLIQRLLYFFVISNSFICSLLFFYFLLTLFYYGFMASTFILSRYYIHLLYLNIIPQSDILSVQHKLIKKT